MTYDLSTYTDAELDALLTASREQMVAWAQIAEHATTKQQRRRDIVCHDQEQDMALQCFAEMKRRNAA